MRLIGGACSTPTAVAPSTVSVERRTWIEAVFGDHLPREPQSRENAISALAGDGDVWRTLHRARHSAADMDELIARLAARALAERAALKAV